MKLNIVLNFIILLTLDYLLPVIRHGLTLGKVYIKILKRFNGIHCYNGANKAFLGVVQQNFNKLHQQHLQLLISSSGLNNVLYF